MQSLLALALLASVHAGTTSAGNVQIGQISVTKDDQGTVLAVDSLDVDGAVGLGLSCRMDRMPMLGALVLAPVVGAGMKASQACLDGGPAAAARVSWTWAGTATTGVEVKAASGSVRQDCVRTALATMEPPLAARCELTVLLGDRAAAEAEAAKLGG